jgi:hypothetical protein
MVVVIVRVLGIDGGSLMGTRDNRESMEVRGRVVMTEITKRWPNIRSMS